MIEFESLVYLDLEKTGCTHVQRLLNTIVDEDLLSFKKHARPLHPVGEKTCLLTIRNPWDWYVSLWAFGCSGRGRVRMRLVNADSEISKLYDDPRDAVAFRRWLQYMHDPKFISSKVLGENYAISSNENIIGLYTHRWLGMIIPGYPVKLGKSLELRQLRKLIEQKSLKPVVIHQESLEKDLTSALLGSNVRKAPNWEQFIIKRALKKQNTSDRAAYTYYYDEDSAALIAERESLIIDAYGYSYDSGTGE